MHPPFPHRKDEDIPLLDTNPAAVRADAFDMVVNGVEVGGGWRRIHDSALLLAGRDSIRDCIAFPKNNSGRDVMLDAPAALDQKQLDELQLQLAPRNETTDRKDA